MIFKIINLNINLIIIYNLFIKYFIIFNLILLTIIPIFSYDLLLIWFFLEINNFLFICFLCIEIKIKKNIFLFYIIQIIASLLLFLPLIINNLFIINQNIFLLNFYLALILKLGIPPFHIWIIYISSFIPWKILFTFLSIQKIIPFYITSLIENNLSILLFIILLSSFIPITKIINLFNFKILLTYSSINQSRWILFLIFFKNLFWLIYISIYTLILFIISIYFNYFKFSFNFYINFLNKLNFNFLSIFLIFNLARIPPLSFFIIKWFSIYIFILNSNILFIFILIIFNSFILIYIYINIIYLNIFFYSFKSKLNYLSNNIIIYKNIYLILFFRVFSLWIIIL